MRVRAESGKSTHFALMVRKDSQMDAELETASANAQAKKRKVSLPFLLTAVVIVIGGYPAGKWVMKKVMTIQEQKKASAKPTLDGVEIDGTQPGLPSTPPPGR